MNYKYQIYHNSLRLISWREVRRLDFNVSKWMKIRNCSYTLWVSERHCSKKEDLNILIFGAVNEMIYLTLRRSVGIWSYSGPCFLAFGLNPERYSVSLRIQAECRKIRTRITPNTDTFHAVWECNVSRLLYKKQFADAPAIS